MSPTSQVDTPRIGARGLLLDQHDRVLLIHARDPDDPGHHWWELPGGGLDDGETLEQAATREVAEETGIHLDQLGPLVWIRESRFRYRNRDHHRPETHRQREGRADRTRLVHHRRAACLP